MVITPRTRNAIAWSAALLAGLSSWIYWQGLERRYRDPGEMKQIWVSERYVPAGTPLRRAHFRGLEVPQSYVAPDAVIDFTVFESSPGHPRFRSRLALPKGTPLLQRDLIALHQQDSLSQRLSDRQVAVSFNVNKARGVGGYLHPGDWIDIYRTHAPIERLPQEQDTTLLFQAVPVLAVNQQWISPEGSIATPPDANEGVEPESETVITVQLNPIAALRLIQCRESATLSVALRAAGDTNEGNP